MNTTPKPPPPSTHLTLGQFLPLSICSCEVDLMLRAQAVITSDTPAAGFRTPRLLFKNKENKYSRAEKAHGKNKIIYPESK